MSSRFATVRQLQGVPTLPCRWCWLACPLTAATALDDPLQQEGVDPENLFTALRAAGGGGGDLAQGSLSLPPGFSLPANFSLPPGFPGLEGLSLPPGSLPADDPGQPAAAAAGVSAGMEGGGSTDDEEDDRGSVGGTQGTGGVQNPPPRTGSINDRKCTKVGCYGQAVEVQQVAWFVAAYNWPPIRQPVQAAMSQQAATLRTRWHCTSGVGVHPPSGGQ